MNDITNPDPDQSELAFESALRPSSLEEFIGQESVRKQVALIIEAARMQSRASDHMLFAGPPGLGKTTLAMIVANESNGNLRITSGPTIQHAGDLAAILASLVSGDVLFIDEIHRMSKSAEEMLYLAMEDFRIDIMVGKGPGATSVPLELEPFTLIGATTRSGLLANPLRDRFGFTANLEFYSTDELVAVITRAAAKLGLVVSPIGASAIASRSRGTPRIANRLLRRVRDFALVGNHSIIDEVVSAEALSLFEVDQYGLDRLDREVLTVLCTQFAGRPVGLATIAVAVGEEQDTIESVVEPFLVRTGLISRTAKGREATMKAFQHLGLKPRTTGQTPLFDL